MIQKLSEKELLFIKNKKEIMLKNINSELEDEESMFKIKNYLQYEIDEIERQISLVKDKVIRVIDASVLNSKIPSYYMYTGELIYVKNINKNNYYALRKKIEDKGNIVLDSIMISQGFKLTFIENSYVYQLSHRGEDKYAELIKKRKA